MEFVDPFKEPARIQGNLPKIQAISESPAKILGIPPLETDKENPSKIQAISASPAKSSNSNANVGGKILGIAGKILQFAY